MKRTLILVTVLVAAALSACSDDGGAVSASASASASASGSVASNDDCRIEGGTSAKRDSEVHVVLDEWSIDLDRHTVDAGVVEFHTTNKGKERHELVIVAGARPNQLTITADGVDEKSLPAGAEVLGEIEPFAAGDMCAGTFELAAGDYTLLCNIVEAGDHEAHAHEGMVTAFTVR